MKAKLMFRLLAITLLLAGLFMTQAFSVVLLLVRGKVTDATSKKPVANAEITFKDLDMGKVIKAKTNDKGEYLQRMQWGNYSVTVKAEGYIPQNEPKLAKPPEGDETTKDFALVPGTGYIASDLSPEELARLKKEDEERKAAEKLTGQVKALFDEAMKAKEAKNYDEAIQKLTEASELAPKQPNILGHIGDCYAQKNDADKAIEYFKKAVEMSPKDGALHTNLGNAYVKKGLMDEAKAEFETAVQVDPLHADLNNYNMGVVMLNAGKIDEALEAFRRSVEANKNNAAAWYQLGLCLVNKADYKAAIEALETCVKVDTKGDYANQAKSLIPELKKMSN